jgi:putative endonuclease
MSAPASRWSVYLVRCRNGSLYTGIATDVARRFAEHQNEKGKAAKYLRGKGPLQLVFERTIGDRQLALSVERRIKKLSKARKETLIERHDAIDRIVSQALDRAGDTGPAVE